MSKPLIPTPEMAPSHRRHCHVRFTKAVMKSFKPAAKGSLWRNKSNFIFAHQDGIFFSGVLGQNPSNEMLKLGLRFELSCKPMAADLVHWHAQDLRDNADRPLSFRATAAIQARSFSMQTWRSSFEDANSEFAASHAIAALEQSKSAMLKEINAKPFSQMVMAAGQHKKHVTLYWACLVLENQIDIALADIEAHYLKTSLNKDQVALKDFIGKIQRSYVSAHASFMDGSDPYWAKLPK